MGANSQNSVISFTETVIERVIIHKIYVTDFKRWDIILREKANHLAISIDTIHWLKTPYVIITFINN